MFNQDITIVNRVINSTTQKKEYKLTTIKGFFSSSKGISINGVDLVPSNGFTCRILMSEKGYVEPRQYNGKGWTLRNDDYIVKGKIKEFNPNEFNYDSFKIANISVKDYGSSDMQHFEISG